MAAAGVMIAVLIPYKMPFDWNLLLAVFRAHQLPHLEEVDARAYERVTKTAQGIGWFHVQDEPQRSSVRVSLWNGTEQDLEQIVVAVRRMFDLDLDPDEVREAMKGDRYLGELWKRSPGIRVARSWNGFETMLTTVLGQLVSVSFARTLVQELMTAAGTRAKHPKTGESISLFPRPRRLLTADLGSIRTSEQRRVAIRHIAKMVSEGKLSFEGPDDHKELRKTLLAIPGVGAWTAEYIAMRGFHDNDAFPATDYALKQELQRHPEVDVKRVRPWRAYAAAALWKSFAASKGNAVEAVL